MGWEAREGERLRLSGLFWTEPLSGHSLDVGVGADDVLDLVRVGVLEGERAGSHPQPFPVFGSEAEHDRQNLAF